MPLPLRTSSAALAAVLFLAACSDSPRTVSGPVCVTSPSPSVAPAAMPEVSPFDSLFAEAGREHRVPAGVLRAIGYVETRWQMVEGDEEFHGMPAAHGVMALRGDRLAEAARLAGLPETAVRTDARANIRAAAALLASIADAMGMSSDDPAAWAPVAARFSGITLAAGRAAYSRDVEAVRTGRRARPEVAFSADVADPCGTPAPLTDQAGALWRASPNFNQRMAGEGGKVHMVIIHSCEGGYVGCWSWLASAESQVSAHYVVREDGAEITQLVREPQRAWHIGASYDAALNAGHDAQLQGVQSNHFTIGVEHAGYAAQTSWPVAQIDASARLVCDVARRWNIPRDKLHIVAHGQLQPWNRTDPGKNWPWDDYLARINRYCAP